MNIIFKKITLLVATSILLGGCNKSPNTSFHELDLVLSPTETKLEERTSGWFADQDLIRKQVLKVCLTHLSEKAEKEGGLYKTEFDNDVFSKFSEFPDCENARKGDIENLGRDAKIYEHQIKNIEQELSTPEAQEEIDKIAAEVAMRLSQHATENQEINQIGEQKLNEFEQAIGNNQE